MAEIAAVVLKPDCRPASEGDAGAAP